MNRNLLAGGGLVSMLMKMQHLETPQVKCTKVRCAGIYLGGRIDRCGDALDEEGCEGKGRIIFGYYVSFDRMHIFPLLLSLFFSF